MVEARVEQQRHRRAVHRQPERVRIGPCAARLEVAHILRTVSTSMTPRCIARMTSGSAPKTARRCPRICWIMCCSHVVCGRGAATAIRRVRPARATPALVAATATSRWSASSTQGRNRRGPVFALQRGGGLREQQVRFARREPRGDVDQVRFQRGAIRKRQLRLGVRIAGVARDACAQCLRLFRRAGRRLRAGRQELFARRA